MGIALVALAIPATFLGLLLTRSILYGQPSLLSDSITLLSQYNVLATMQSSFHGVWPMFWHSFQTLPFWFAVSGIICAWLTVIAFPKLPELLKKYLPFVHYSLTKQYGFDAFNHLFFVRGTKRLSRWFYEYGDLKCVDSIMVDGVGRNVTRISKLLRKMQSGYLYHYVFSMIIGLLIFLFWLLLR